MSSSEMLTNVELCVAMNRHGDAEEDLGACDCGELVANLDGETYDSYWNDDEARWEWKPNDRPEAP